MALATRTVAPKP